MNGSDLMAGALKSGGLSLAGGRKRTWRYLGLLVRWGWGTEQKNANRLRAETGWSMTDRQLARKQEPKSYTPKELDSADEKEVGPPPGAVR